MQMIGHEQEEIWPPQKFFLPVANRFKQPFGDIRQCQLVSETLLAIDSDEIDFFLWINPRRNLVWQSLALRDFHDGMLGVFIVVGKMAGRRRAAASSRMLDGAARRPYH